MMSSTCLYAKAREKVSGVRFPIPNLKQCVVLLVNSLADTNPSTNLIINQLFIFVVCAVLSTLRHKFVLLANKISSGSSTQARQKLKIKLELHVAFFPIIRNHILKF